MKKFSKHWTGSKRPEKQRKYLAEAPLHLRKKLLNVSLSKDLRKKYGKRAVTIRKDDVVKILAGKFKKKEGKVTRVDYKKLKIYVEGVQLKKMDGSITSIPLRNSNMQIIELQMEDKKRTESLKRKFEGKTEKPKANIEKSIKTEKNKLNENKK